MGTEWAVRPKTMYSIEAATKSLPPDVSPELFLKIMGFCRPGARIITGSELTRVTTVARIVQKLSASEQLLLLSKQQTIKSAEAGNMSETGTFTLQEQEAWIKEVVSEAYTWVRELRRLGVASAASYIFAGRRSSQQPPKDWANEVLYHHYCEELTVQDSVLKYVEGLENAFLQLPDRRWYVKYQGEAIPPLPDNLSGLRCIHALIKQNYLREVVVREDGQPYCVFMPPSSALSDQKQRRNVGRSIESNEVRSDSIKSFANFRAKANRCQDVGKTRNRISDLRSNPEAKQIGRAIHEIASHNSRVAGILNSSISADGLGVLSFSDSVRDTWITEIPEICADATLEKVPDGWVAHVPFTREAIEIPPDREKGIGYIARILQATGVPLPVGLLANSELLNALANRPPYQKLFKRTSRRVVKLNDRVEFDQGTQTIIEAVKTATRSSSKYYEITHVIPKESPLAKYIATGFVSLTTEGLSGVLYLLKKRLAATTIDGFKMAELVQLVTDIDAAIKYVERYEELLSQIEHESNAVSDKVQKAIASATDYLWGRAEYTLGKHLEEHIKTGKLCSYNGPWLWHVHGLMPEFPDIVELAKDHIYMKLRKFSRQNIGLPHRTPILRGGTGR